MCLCLNVLEVLTPIAFLGSGRRHLLSAVVLIVIYTLYMHSFVCGRLSHVKVFPDSKPWTM